MTIVKPSSKKQRSKFGNNNSKNNNLMKSVDCSDVFSDVHVMMKKNKEIGYESDLSYESENEEEEGESQAPKYNNF